MNLTLKIADDAGNLALNLAQDFESEIGFEENEDRKLSGRCIACI
jgi:hypothetical protein